MHFRQREKFAQHIGVTFRGLRYPCRFACEPSFYLPPRIANRFGMFEYARISHQPQESEQANPRGDRPDRSRSIADRASRALGGAEQMSSRAHR